MPNFAIGVRVCRDVFAGFAPRSFVVVAMVSRSVSCLQVLAAPYFRAVVCSVPAAFRCSFRLLGSRCFIRAVLAASTCTLGLVAFGSAKRSRFCKPQFLSMPLLHPYKSLSRAALLSYFVFAAPFSCVFGFRSRVLSLSHKSPTKHTTRRCTRPPTAPFVSVASSLHSLRFRRRVSLVFWRSAQRCESVWFWWCCRSCVRLPCQSCSSALLRFRAFLFLCGVWAFAFSAFLLLRGVWAFAISALLLRAAFWLLHFGASSFVWRLVSAL